ncbi:MAG: hypothetical protein EZS26_000627 [Candidatus Ordinivivax streblomastigis]|uniref:Uncharacterized protein n=1 Tax=Candidatus Ordinivivax streblomastigis TaxID=2540710 RepID=A0A5M8P3Q8_9BACT|nr:MAG: hypothetical protein EZS26_000627 [Candidatus Ordinivivax streblomastigis]
MNKKELEWKAKKIVFLLSQNEKLSLKQLCGLMDDKQLNIMLSLGSLLKEGKISMHERENDVIVESTYYYTHMYY